MTEISRRSLMFGAAAAGVCATMPAISAAGVPKLSWRDWETLPRAAFHFLPTARVHGEDRLWFDQKFGWRMLRAAPDHQSETVANIHMVDDYYFAEKFEPDWWAWLDKMGKIRGYGEFTTTLLSANGQRYIAHNNLGRFLWRFA